MTNALDLRSQGGSRGPLWHNRVGSLARDFQHLGDASQPIVIGTYGVSAHGSGPHYGVPMQSTIIDQPASCSTPKPREEGGDHHPVDSEWQAFLKWKAQDQKGRGQRSHQGQRSNQGFGRPQKVAKRNGSAKPDSRMCYNCRSYGHLARDCRGPKTEPIGHRHGPKTEPAGRRQDQKRGWVPQSNASDVKARKFCGSPPPPPPQGNGSMVGPGGFGQSGFGTISIAFHTHKA